MSLEWHAQIRQSRKVRAVGCTSVVIGLRAELLGQQIAMRRAWESTMQKYVASTNLGRMPVVELY